MTLVGTSSAGLTEWLLDRIALPIAIATAVIAKECRECGMIDLCGGAPNTLDAISDSLVNVLKVLGVEVGLGDVNSGVDFEP